MTLGDYLNSFYEDGEAADGSDTAADARQAQLFASAARGDDPDRTLTLTDPTLTDAEQLSQWRSEMAGLMPFEDLHPRDADQ